MKFSIDNSFFKFLETGFVYPSPYDYCVYRNSKNPSEINHSPFVKEGNNYALSSINALSKYSDFMKYLITKVHIFSGYSQMQKIELDRGIRYITTPFMEKYISNFDSINKLFNKNDVDYQSSVFIINHKKEPCQYIYFKYEKARLFIVDFTERGLNSYYNFEWSDTGNINEFKNYEVVLPKGFFSGEGELYNLAYQFTIKLVWFLKYCKTEVKILPPKKKDKLFGCKYFNDTNNRIEIIDSTWFTSLVKSDAFNVRGHFRLQPYGTGHSDKKLIWISDFQKSGYTKKYKKPDFE